MTDEQFAIYAAGFFDGEGTLTVTRGPIVDKSRRTDGKTARQATRQFILLIAISNTNHAILIEHQQRYGGTVSDMAPQRERRKACWKWMLRGTRMIEFVRLIRPYLIVKAQEADVFLELHERIKSFKPQYRKIRWGGMLPLPEEEIAARQALVDKLKACPNRRWTPSYIHPATLI